MVAMTSFHVEKCYHLMSEHKAYSRHVYRRVCQFLIYSTFVLVVSHSHYCFAF